jgi:hypothetical protein
LFMRGNACAKSAKTSRKAIAQEAEKLRRLELSELRRRRGDQCWRFEDRCWARAESSDDCEPEGSS